jgi:hypothetical protein
VPGIFFGSKRFFGKRNAPPGCEPFGCLGEVYAFVEFHKPENGAARAAPEALEGLPGGIDGKRRRFFAVKRAKRLENSARPLQREIAADDVDDIIGRGNLLDELFGDHFLS